MTERDIVAALDAWLLPPLPDSMELPAEVVQRARDEIVALRQLLDKGLAIRIEALEEAAQCVEQSVPFAEADEAAAAIRALKDGPK